MKFYHTRHELSVPGQMANEEGVNTPPHPLLSVGPRMIAKTFIDASSGKGDGIYTGEVQLRLNIPIDIKEDDEGNLVVTVVSTNMRDSDAFSSDPNHPLREKIDGKKWDGEENWNDFVDLLALVLKGEVDFSGRKNFDSSSF